jgi:hypothetical protein
MSFQQNSEKWLAIAESNKPELQKTHNYPQGVVESKRNPLAFQGWQMQPAGRIEELYTKELQESDSFILDFGEHLVGYLRFSLKLVGTAMGGPLRLKFVFGEVPAEVTEPFDPFQGTLSRAWLQDEIITLDSIPGEICLPRRFAFRYLKVEVLAASFDYRFRFENIYCETVTSGREDIESLINPGVPEDLQLLDQVGLRTLRNGMQTVLEDGPKRDRRLWLGDSPLQALTNFYSFKNYEIEKRCLYLFAALAHEDGRLPACLYEYPFPHRGDEFILEFALLYGVYLLDYVRYSGDRETAGELWPVALKQVDFVREYIDRENLFNDVGKWWIFIDWQPDLDKQASMQGLIIYALKGLLKLARAIDRAREASFLPGMIRDLEVAARQKLFSGREYLFLSDKKKQVSWASQVWMILAEVVDEAAGTKILQKLLLQPGTVKPAGPYIYHYALEAFLKCGLEAEALNLLKSYWGKMIDYGATTFWEVFDPDDHYLSPYGNHLLNSYCHSWSCTPTYFIRKYFLESNI